MRKLLLTIFILLISVDCFAGAGTMGSLAGIPVPSGGALPCTGSMQGGNNESFEVSEGSFCTTGWSETDTEGVISTYATDQFHCGTHSLKITPHTTTGSEVSYAITDANTFTNRFYFRFTGFEPSTSKVIYEFRDSSDNQEMLVTLRRNADTTYRLYVNSIGVYFSPVVDTWQYLTVSYDGTGTTDGTLIKMYNLAGVAQTAVDGLDATTISSTEADGISIIKRSSSTVLGTVWYDDELYSSAAADLSGGYTCP